MKLQTDDSGVSRISLRAASRSKRALPATGFLDHHRNQSTHFVHCFYLSKLLETTSKNTSYGLFRKSDSPRHSLPNPLDLLALDQLRTVLAQPSQERAHDIDRFKDVRRGRRRLFSCVLFHNRFSIGVPRETIRKNPKQFGISRYEKEPDNRLSLPSKIRGGSSEIRNIVIVCSAMYLPVESGLENRNITEIVLSLGNSSYSQNSPFLSTFSTPASPRRFVSIMTDQRTIANIVESDH